MPNRGTGQEMGMCAHSTQSTRTPTGQVADAATQLRHNTHLNDMFPRSISTGFHDDEAVSCAPRTWPTHILHTEVHDWYAVTAAGCGHSQYTDPPTCTVCVIGVVSIR